MRHGKRRTRFGRQPSHRLATLKSIARSVIIHQAIKTTHVKAKEARRVVDSLITTAKEDTLAARRKAFSVLGSRTLVAKLFKEVAPLFANRKGGYTRIIPYSFRKGDGATLVFLELTEKKPEEKPTKKSAKDKKELKVTQKKQPDKKTPPKAQPKVAPAIKPAVKEEKTVEAVKREKAKDEMKKITKQKGFLKKMGGFFRRKSNM